MSKLGNTVAVFTLDPGTTTGYTEGMYELTQGRSSYEIVEAGLLKAAEISCVDMATGVERIARRLMNFMAEMNIAGVPIPRCYFVYEDFILRPWSANMTRTLLDPVRVMAMLEGMLVKHRAQMIWVPQQPSDAKQITNQRLKQNGLWTRGDSKYPHRVDGKRHAVVWVRNAMRG